MCLMQEPPVQTCVPVPVPSLRMSDLREHLPNFLHVELALRRQQNSCVVEACHTSHVQIIWLCPQGEKH